MKSIPGRRNNKCEDLGQGPVVEQPGSQARAEGAIGMSRVQQVREVSRDHVREGRLHFCSEYYGMSLEQERDAAEMYTRGP